MIDITYLNAAKQEQTLSYPDYDSYQRSQMACSIPIADHYEVVKLTFNGHELDYKGTIGGVYYFLIKQDLTQFN